MDRCHDAQEPDRADTEHDHPRAGQVTGDSRRVDGCCEALNKSRLLVVERIGDQVEAAGRRDKVLRHRTSQNPGGVTSNPSERFAGIRAAGQAVRTRAARIPANRSLGLDVTPPGFWLVRWRSTLS